MTDFKYNSRYIQLRKHLKTHIVGEGGWRVYKIKVTAGQHPFWKLAMEHQWKVTACGHAYESDPTFHFRYELASISVDLSTCNTACLLMSCFCQKSKKLWQERLSPNARKKNILFNLNSKIIPNWFWSVLFVTGILGNCNACTKILMKSWRGTGYFYWLRLTL